MKLHLPKKLLVAVLAAVSVSSAYRANAAATLSTPVYVHTVETDELLNVLPLELAAGVIDGNYVKPYVKAGGGTLVIEGITDGGNYATTKTPVYTREGTTIIKDSKIMYAPWNDGASTVLQVAGKNAEMVLDNSQMVNSEGSDGDPRVNGAYLAVGGPDGKGVLTLKNNSRLTCSYSLIAGYHKEGNWYGYHIPTSTTNTIDPTSGRFAEGEYKYDESSGLYYGEAVVNVLSGSKLALGSALIAAETTINVDGAGSVFSDGFVYGSGAASYLGRQHGSTTRINITNGGKFKSSGWLITSDYLGVKDAAVHIGVDGAGSELNAKYLFMGYGQENGADSGSCCESTLAVKNGATVNVSESYLGEFNENSGDSKALVTVDSSSSFNAQDAIYVSKGATIDNSGIIAAPIIEMTNGTLIVQGAGAKVETEALTLSGGAVLQLVGQDVKPLSIDKVEVRDGRIILDNGAALNVDGSLTLAQGTVVTVGAGYQTGDVLLTSTGTLTDNGIIVEFEGAEGQYEYVNGSYVITSIAYIMPEIDPGVVKSYTLSNWGMATASRSFVNTVRGQRTNTGCIANGRGTAWVAVLGGNHDIDGSDISLKGAAVGADMKVGEKSSVGIAFGYVEGDIRPSGLRSADQEGTYVALYGEHGLRKLSATSCLSLDWVATYGQTDTEWDGADWEQQSLQLNSRLNWNKKVNDRLCVSLFGGLEYYTNESDTVGNTKTGSIQNLRGEIGVGARYVAWGTPAVTDGKSGLVLARGCEKLVLNGEIRYMNDMVRSNPVIEQDGLRGKGDANPGRQGVGIEAGATYRIGERWSASANYGFNTMEDSREHRVNVGASYTF